MVLEYKKGKWGGKTRKPELKIILTTPHPPYLPKNMLPKYAIQWGSVSHKSWLEPRDFYRKYGIRTPPPFIWHTNPPSYAIYIYVFIGGGGWSLIC